MAPKLQDDWSRCRRCQQWSWNKQLYENDYWCKCGCRIARPRSWKHTAAAADYGDNYGQGPARELPQHT
eukprot:2884232-Pyramimonas_sp.AAC.1